MTVGNLFYCSTVANDFEIYETKMREKNPNFFRRESEKCIYLFSLLLFFIYLYGQIITRVNEGVL